jgi:hypothetical protein
LILMLIGIEEIMFFFHHHHLSLLLVTSIFRKVIFAKA